MKFNEMRHITCKRGDAPRRRANGKSFLLLQKMHNKRGCRKAQTDK